MTDIYTKTPIRIPVKLVDGQWEYFYGGGLHVCNGAVGDLVIDKRTNRRQEILSSFETDKRIQNSRSWHRFAGSTDYQTDFGHRRFIKEMSDTNECSGFKRRLFPYRAIG